MTATSVLGDPADARVGLLGGSFNPAHNGHLHISRLALRLLKLQTVWWLVSPQNPLKPEHNMAPLEDRLAGASALAAGERITVTDIERDLGTCYTADTLLALKHRFGQARFVWLMGADNLIQIDRWERWEQIFEIVPVAVFPRPSYSEQADRAKAARHFARYRLEPDMDGERAGERAGELADRKPPVWMVLRTPESPLSATEIRARGDSPDGPSTP